MKILIGVPCMDTLPLDYVNCLLRLDKPDGTKIVHLPLSLIYVAREKIAQHAVERGFDYVLFVDSDMVFPPDLIAQLLKHDKDIVSGACFARKAPHFPCFFSSISSEKCQPMTEYSRGLVEVAGVGAACVMIKTQVFKDIYASGQLCYFPIVNLGEDVAFCRRAIELGYKVFVDTNLQIGHIGSKIYGEDDFDAEQN